MPVIWHQATGHDSDGKLGLAFCEDRFKSNGVDGEQPTDPTIQEVVGKIAGGKMRTTWYGGQYVRMDFAPSRKVSRLF